MTTASTSEPVGDVAQLPGPLPQAFAVVGGMAAWGVAVLIAYPMVQIACAVGSSLLVHMVRWIATVVAVAATAAGIWIYRRAQAVDAERIGPERVQRVRFMGAAGALLSASGALLLIVEDIATWVIDPCL